MTTRTPITEYDARLHLRVIQGGLAAAAAREDEPDAAELERLQEEMAAAALLAELLAQDGRHITFDTPAGAGRVRAQLVDADGAREELSLVHLVDPARLTDYLEVAS